MQLLGILMKNVGLRKKRTIDNPLFAQLTPRTSRTSVKKPFGSLPEKVGCELLYLLGNKFINIPI